MEFESDESVRAIMESLRLSCDRDARSHLQSIESATSSFNHALSSIQATARDSVHCRGKLLEVKAKFREAEDELVKAISAKNRKEAKRIALMDSLTARKSVVEELRRTLQEQKARRHQYDEILSRQSSVSEETSSHNGTDELQEAISWYEKVLGFRVEAGHGVRFIFKNISVNSPDEEYSLTIRHADNTFSLLECAPQLDDLKELISELNETNGLFKFVRIIRLKFQEAAKQGVTPHSNCLPEESTIISTSAPTVSMSDAGTESSNKRNEHQGQRVELNRDSKKQNRGKSLKNANITSPGSAHTVTGLKDANFSSPGSLRRSTRAKARNEGSVEAHLSAKSKRSPKYLSKS